MKSSTKYISIIIALCLIITPLCCYAQRSRTTETEQADSFEAQRAGIADAKNDSSCPMWYSMGCLFNIFGVAAANLIVPKPSHERLMGKPMEYVWAYTESYKSTRRSLQTRYALYGCLTSGVAAAISLSIAFSQEDAECCLTGDWSCEALECSDPLSGMPCTDEEGDCSTSDGCSQD